MQKLFDIIKSVHSLSRQEENLIKENFYFEEFAPKQYILRADDVSRRIGFVLEGIIMTYFYDCNGNEIIRCFHNKNHFLGLSGYIEQEMSGNYVQTITKSRILFLNKSNDELLNKTLSNWPLITRKISEISLFEKNKATIELFHKDAEARYKSFISTFGQDSNQIPLKYIASYLGIKQQSLSRIRKNIRW